MTTAIERFADSKNALLSEAKARAGLSDFGKDDWREGYERLLDELDEAGFSASGALAAREHILSNLVARLKAVDGFARHPEAMERPISRPLIVTGIVRSGTTALHKLLAMDRQFQGAEHWICAAPQPRPARASWEANADFEHARADMEAMVAVSPEVLEDHGMAVDGVEESLNVLSHGFHSNMFPSQYSIPRYDAWYRSTCDRASYRYFSDVLRLIGAYEPDRTWLIKTPTDTFPLQEVLDVFPDAMIVQTHRDPLQAVPSIVNLIGGAHRMFRGEGHVDYNAIFEREQEMWAQAMERAERAKADNPGRVFDVQFKDFVTDQMSVVRAIYAHFDLPLSSAAEAAMGEWLSKNPRKSTTMQRFSPEDFGGTTPGLEMRFKTYRQLFGYAA